MKQRIFSARLYWEGMRQLRLMGILFSIAVALIGVFSPVATYINYLNNDVLFNEITPETVSGFIANPLIVLAFCIVAPFLTLNLFSFLNKRESSDFYHNIPATRTCLFFSFFAAVISWLLIFVVSTSVLTTVAYAMFPKLYIVNYLSVLEISLSCFVAGFLVAAAVAISMSITGTMLMNILLALILIFLPRILIALVIESVTSLFPLVAGLDFLPFLSARFNIASGFVITTLTEGFSTAVGMFTSFASMLYTFVLGLIYTALAWLLFCKRRSEAAGHSAPTARLQALFRFLVGFTVSSIITLALYLMSEGTASSYDIFTFFFLYLITVLIVAVFEILCTRRWKGLFRRCGTTVLLLVAANLALIGGMSGTNYYLTSYAPAADDISSVKLIGFNSYSHSYDEDTVDYFNSKAEKIELTDSTIREIISRQLSDTLDTLSLSANHYYDRLYQNASLVVSVRSNGVSHTRRIIVTSEDIQALTQALTENNDFQQLYMKLPENYSHILVNGNIFRRGEGAEDLFDALQSEVRDMGFANWFSLLNDSAANISYTTVYKDGTVNSVYSGTDSESSDVAEPSAPAQQVLQTLSVYIPDGSGWASFNVPIYPLALPKTARCYLELYEKQQGNSYTEFLNALNGDSEQIFDIQFSLYNCDPIKEESVLWYGREDIEKQPEAFADLGNQLRRASIGSVNPTAAFVEVECGYLGQDVKGDSEYHYMRGYFTLNQEAYNILSTLE